VLLHVASLPSRYGIGDIGPAAMAWIDRLQEAGQSWWQALPLGPTGYGNSPYQSLSSFAGNELLISPDWLIEDGLLQPGDCAVPSLSPTSIDYAAVIPFKRQLLATAWSRFHGGARADLRAPYEEFCAFHQHWIEDYAAFRALKAAHNGAYYLNWPPELARRETQALAAARQQLAEPIDQVRFAQFLLFSQAERLKAHARARHIRMIGDLPFFVSPDSSDVWANPEMFLLDEERRPRVVAGVPPDYFSAQGQLWGNPVYDWGAARQTGYRWYLDRLRALLAHVDIVRLDHFRAFAAAWHVPFGAPTAQTGEWVPGPGADLFQAIADSFGTLPFIAEDLGLITPDVVALRDQFQLPSTRVLQFAFDGRPDNPHLPQNYSPNTVAYTGTHDNPTTRGWFEALSEPERQTVWNCLKCPAGGTGEVAAALIELAWASSAALAIAPLQDLLNLGNEARMNMPGRADGNWAWRCTEEMLTPAVFQWLHEVTAASQRLHAS
jgi:4-alpha-glucanotransferase